MESDIMDAKKKCLLDEKSSNYYEARWCSMEESGRVEHHSEFCSKQALHIFYERHKKEKHRYEWNLSYKNQYGEVLKNIDFEDVDYDSRENFDKEDDGRYSYNIFENRNMGDFYHFEDILKMIDLAKEGKIQ